MVILPVESSICYPKNSKSEGCSGTVLAPEKTAFFGDCATLQKSLPFLHLLQLPRRTEIDAYQNDKAGRFRNSGGIFE